MITILTPYRMKRTRCLPFAPVDETRAQISRSPAARQDSSDGITQQPQLGANDRGAASCMNSGMEPGSRYALRAPSQKPTNSEAATVEKNMTFDVYILILFLERECARQQAAVV